MNILLWRFSPDNFIPYDGNGLRGSVPHDAQIQSYSGVSYIKGIVLISAEHTFKIPGGSPVAFDLCEAGNSRLYQISEFISRNYIGKFVTIGMHMRPWSNNTHFPGQYIQELWKFIKVRFS